MPGGQGHPESPVKCTFSGRNARLLSHKVPLAFTFLELPPMPTAPRTTETACIREGDLIASSV